MEDGGQGPGSAPALPSIHIANEVIGVIAGLAAAEVAGVAELSGGLASGLGEMLGRKPSNRGVRVDVEGRDVDLALHIVMRYGVRIPEVAQKVQQHVKEQVESATGLTVRTCDIHIQGVAFESQEGSDGRPEA